VKKEWGKGVLHVGSAPSRGKCSAQRTKQNQ